MVDGPWNGRSRFLAYAAAVLVPVLALGGLIARAVTLEADQAALNNAVADAKSVAQLAVESQLDNRPLSEGLGDEERDQITRLATPLLDSGSILRFRLRDTSGRIMFDASTPDATNYPDDPDDDVAEALADGFVALKTNLDSDAADGSLSEGVEAIEVYLPVTSLQGGEPVGALEVYVPYAPIGAARDASLAKIYRLIVLGTTFVWLTLAMIMWSVTSRIHRQNDQNNYLVLHDSSTGLPNRTLFTRTVAGAVSGQRASVKSGLVAVVTLERFKEISDVLGHAAGDEVLRSVAERLRSVLRPGDTAARLGGDEFGLILPGLSSETGEHMLTKVRETIGEEIEIGGTPIALESRVGTAEWPSDSGDADLLLRQADMALHSGKQSGEQISRYTSDMSPGDRRTLALLAELRRALTEDELRVHYQPKVDVQSGRLTGFEALLRWDHPTWGLLNAESFIPLAEPTGVIEPLTRWVFNEAARQLAQWGADAEGLSIAVNISARNLREPDLADWILSCLQTHGVAHSRIVIEITETSLSGDADAAAAQVASLEEAGVCVSIDDFGQGHTSLSQLATLKVGELKVDARFTAMMLESDTDHAIVASIISLGHQLGLHVVAEGVGSTEALQELKALGCDTAQGFLFAEALKPDDVPRFIAQRAKS